MKIIYHCFGGTHSSVTAAASHLGLLSRERKPHLRELLALPFFDTLEANEQGNIILMGVDQMGNEIYFTGRRSKPEYLENILGGLAQSYHLPVNSYRLINVMPKVNLTMRIGGFLSRQCRWIKTGRPLVALGTVWAYPAITKLVRKALAKESSG